MDNRPSIEQARRADFNRLWAGQTISMIGSLVTREGLPLAAAITLAATPWQMGLLSAAESAPVLLFGLLAGVWIDRLRRRPVMIAADFGRALLLRIEQLFIVGALVGVLTLFFDVAYQSYLPTLIGRRDLLAGNSRLEVSASLAEIVGPGLAGVLVQLITAPLAILVDACSFMFSAASVALIRTPEPLPLSDLADSTDAAQPTRTALPAVDSSARSSARCTPFSCCGTLG